MTALRCVFLCLTPVMFRLVSLRPSLNSCSEWPPSWPYLCLALYSFHSCLSLELSLIKPTILPSDQLLISDTRPGFLHSGPVSSYYLPHANSVLFKWEADQKVITKMYYLDGPFGLRPNCVLSFECPSSLCLILMIFKMVLTTEW